MGRMRVGQPVDIKVDAYKGVTFHGHVASINPASENTYALVPAQNASGNFVKVTQRIPVRVEVDDQRSDMPLRPGMSVETYVKVKVEAVFGSLRKPSRRARLAQDHHQHCGHHRDAARDHRRHDRQRLVAEHSRQLRRRRRPGRVDRDRLSHRQRRGDSAQPLVCRALRPAPVLLHFDRHLHDRLADVRPFEHASASSSSGASSKAWAAAG